MNIHGSFMARKCLILCYLEVTKRRIVTAIVKNMQILLGTIYIDSRWNGRTRIAILVSVIYVEIKAYYLGPVILAIK